MKKTYDITAVGEALIDFTEAGLSDSGMRLFEQNPGGAPANLLSAAANLGVKTAFIGKVGQDAHGRFLRETMERANIDTLGLILAEDVFTTLAFVSLNGGEREFSFARKPGADTRLTAEELDPYILDNTTVLHFGSLSLTDEPARTATYTAIQRAKEAGALISYDPNYRAPLWDSKEEAVSRMGEPLSMVDVMKLSDEETELLTGLRDPEKAAGALSAQGVGIVAVTLGKDGALVCKSGVCRSVPGHKATAIDTTGAGDAFWGGFLYKLLQADRPLGEISLEEAVSFARFANATAAICIGRRGGIPAMPTLQEVEALMARLG
ncbi:MAG: carbohydrate kinase [Oscillospiraceae bacterium]|nr:carbohydrate kinase [Oscillospiraceae bacterium]